MTERSTVTHEEWAAEGAELFGADQMQWQFVCPVCGHVATPADWKEAGAPSGAVAFSCVGRWIEGSRDAFESTGVGPCSYAGGGLFALNPVTVNGPNGETHDVFDFAREGSDG